MEGVNDHDVDNTELITTLRLRGLIEAQPETRFHRLLHRKHFDEAETFAQMFNLDIQVSGTFYHM